MSQVDFSAPPYTESEVGDRYDAEGCAGVGAWFGAHPISPGDTIEVYGETRTIVAVKVLCNGTPVYSSGSPPPGQPPDVVHDYAGCPVVVKIWLAP